MADGGWESVLNSFKQQFEAVGPEKFADAGDADTRYALADKMMSSLAQGASQVSGIMATNKREQIAAAEANKKQGYKRIYNKTGGYDFLDPNGNKISPLEWSMAKGVSVTDALQGSYDKNDINFLQDMDAMKLDLATGKMDFNKAIDLMSQDYPTVFGRQGVQGGGGVYQGARKAAGLQKVGEVYGNAQGRNDAEKALITFAKKAPAFNTYSDALTELDKIQNNMGEYGRLKKLTTTERNDLTDQLSEIIDQIFVVPNPQSAIKTYPF